MCGMWKILPDFCQEPLVGRFSEKPRAFQLLLKMIRFFFFFLFFLFCCSCFWFFCLVWFGFFFFGHSWENFTFFKEDRSAGWEGRHPVCDLSLPIGARPADTAHVSPLGQWENTQLKSVAGYVVIDSWSTVSIIVSCPEAAKEAPLIGHFPVPAAGY